MSEPRENVTTTNYVTLAFASQDQNLLDVRHFSIHDAMSELFEVSVLAYAKDDAIDLDAIIGKGAALRVQTPNHNATTPVAVWAGVVAHMSQVHAEPAGMSAYHILIVPMFWRTTLRKNSRIFQHMTTPAIVKKILGEYEIAFVDEMKAETYKRHEYCVQYGESDFAFISRLLEDAGISYFFTRDVPEGDEHEGEHEKETKDKGEGAKDKRKEMTRLVLSDAPHKNAARKAPLAYAGHQTPRWGGDQDFCATVSVTQKMSPGKLTVRDFDFQIRPDTVVQGKAASATDEDIYEVYEYVPGAFWWEGATNKDVARTEPTPDRDARTKHGNDAERRRRQVVAFHTNAMDLRPGAVVGINQGGSGPDHPRKDLSPKQKLLVVETSFEGAHNGDWSMVATCVHADHPHRPERRTPKPRIYGVQSAIVVGPAPMKSKCKHPNCECTSGPVNGYCSEACASHARDAHCTCDHPTSCSDPGTPIASGGARQQHLTNPDIYTDEFGRVRVQFHWDREHKYDDMSSCWIRVSQAWAGGGFGVVTIPRIGHEVLVGFFEGDPDRPIITGRVYNTTTGVPYKLPEDKTKSGWKTDTSPGGGGYNEIMFEDKKGEELVHVQAQKDLSYIVKSAETADIGRARNVRIGGQSKHAHGTDALHVGDKRSIVVGRWSSTDIGDKYTLSVGGHTGMVMAKEGTIVVSTGKASVSLGKDISLQADDAIHIHAGERVHISTEAGTINLQGGSDVSMNKVAGGSAVTIAAPDKVRAAGKPPPASLGGTSGPPFKPTGGGWVARVQPIRGTAAPQVAPKKEVPEAATKEAVGPKKPNAAASDPHVFDDKHVKKFVLYMLDEVGKTPEQIKGDLVGKGRELLKSLTGTFGNDTVKTLLDFGIDEAGKPEKEVKAAALEKAKGKAREMVNDWFKDENPSPTGEKT